MKKNSNISRLVKVKFFFITLLIILLDYQINYGQEYHADNSLPSYSGGNKALKEFFEDNLNYPDKDATGVIVTIFATFRVNENGQVEDIKVEKGIDPKHDHEAIRVIQLSQGWKPGFRMGKPASFYVRVPIEFHLAKEIPNIVSGRITDKITGELIEGTLIIISGTNVGTVTNKEGHYELEVPGENSTLEFRAIGYLTQNIPIGSNRIINIELDAEYYLIDFTDNQ